MEVNGIVVKYFTTFDPGDNFESIVEGLARARCLVVLICSYDPDLGGFVWAIQQRGVMQAGWAWVSLWRNVVESAYSEVVQLAIKAGRPVPDMSIFQGLLCLDFAITPDTAEYHEFEGEVRTAMRDFSIAVPSTAPVDSYAGALHDAVLLYAHAVAAVVQQGSSPSDTEAMLAAMKNASFDGITGRVQLDLKTGDRLVDSQVRWGETSGAWVHGRLAIAAFQNIVHRHELPHDERLIMFNRSNPRRRELHAQSG